MEPDLYDQPVKIAVRQKILAHAIDSLTSNRESSLLTNETHILSND
jgi:hypothetical protein